MGRFVPRGWRTHANKRRRGYGGSASKPRGSFRKRFTPRGGRFRTKRPYQ